MGLGPAAVRLYLELWQRKLLANVDAVIDMGSQELHLTKATFERLIDAAGLPGYNEQVFADLAHWPGQPRCSARPFYQLLGAKDYRCMDLNEEYGAIRHDINLPLTDPPLFGRFDLVTDHGTNEHAFNVVEAYRTMHRLCKGGGLMVINQNAYGGNGYFNFDLSFFEMMAAANGYRILFSSSIVTVNKKHLTDEDVRTLPPALKGKTLADQIHVPLSNELLDVMCWSKDHADLGICYVFQKQSDADFQYAYQGEYMAQFQANYGYQLQFLPEPPSRTYIPLRASSSDGMQQGVLESISFKVLVRHLLHRLGRRIKARVGLR
jgi:hypothetical protein